MSGTYRPRVRVKALLLGLFVIAGAGTGLWSMANQPAQAATSSYLNFQARLLNSAGAVVADGNYHIEFKIYDSAGSGASAQGVCSLNSSTDDCWWLETRTTGNLVRVVNGYFSVQLGSVTAFGASIPWDQQLWLTMNIGGTGGSPSWDGEMLSSGSRIQLTGVPYAFTAGKLQAAASGVTNVLTFATPSGGNKTLTLPNETGTVCTTGSICSGYQAANSTTLQNAYDADSDGSDTVIQLSANDDGIIIRNPASSGSDSTYALTIDQLSTGARGGLSIQSAGTGNLLLITDTTATARDVLVVANGGALTLTNQTNSAAALQVRRADGTTPVLTVDTTSSNVTIGDTSGAPTDGRLNIQSGDGGGAGTVALSINAQNGQNQIGWDVASGNFGYESAVLNVSRSRGTLASRAAIQNNDEIFAFNGVGYYSATQNSAAANLFFAADGNWTTSAAPGKIVLGTHANTDPDIDFNSINRLKIDSGGKVVIGGYDDDGFNTEVVAGSAKLHVISGLVAADTGVDLFKVTDQTATARDVLTIADGGATTFRNQTDSTTAFRIQNAAASATLLAADTTNSQLNMVRSVFSGNLLGSAIATVQSTSTVVTAVDQTNSMGQGSSVAIGVDGLPVISYLDLTNNYLKVLKCGNSACSSGNTINNVETSVTVADETSIAVGTDGNPIIAYRSAGGANDLRVTKCANIYCSSVAAATSVDTSNNVGRYPHIAIGTDGLAWISHWDNTNSGLRASKCTNTNCTSTTNYGVNTAPSGAGNDNAIAIGTDGNPIVSYYDAATTSCDNSPTDECTLKIARYVGSGGSGCSDAAWTCTTVEDPAGTGDVGSYNDIAIGSDGLPVITFYDTTNTDPKLLRCASTSCSSVASSTTLDTSGPAITGQQISVTIGSDGLPIVVYKDSSNTDLRVTKCGNLACSSGNTSTTVDVSANVVGEWTDVVILPDGLPFISEYDNNAADLKAVRCGNTLCSAAGSTYTGGIELGSQGLSFQNAYIQNIKLYDPYNPFTLSVAGSERLRIGPDGATTLKSQTANGFRVQNTTGITNYLSVNTSSGQVVLSDNLLTVSNNGTEYANNGRAEDSTFTMWTGAPAGGTIARYTTAGDNIATGTASASVTTTATAAHGVENTLSTTLTNSLKYQVSFAIKADSANSAFSTLDVMYSYNGAAVRHCVAGTPYYSTGTASQSTTTITGVGTTFTSAMVGKTFVFADGNSTVISGFTNATTLTAATSQTVSSQSYGIYDAGFSVKSSVWSRITCVFTAPATGTTITSSNSVMIRQTDATARVFYVDNLSVKISGDVNHAADGSVDLALGTNWTAFDADGGAGTTTLARETTIIYDTSGSVSDITTAHVNLGMRNNMTITPSVSTQYLVTFYARSSNTFNDITVGFLPAGGNSVPVSAQLCTDYNTQSVSTSGWTKITCIVTTPSSGITDPDLVIYQPTATARTFYVDALSIALNGSIASNVQIGGANKGGPITLLTLDRASSAPIAANNDAYLGSMYYDTTTGRIQCYESDGWGACGAPPDNIVNLNPEYPGAVLNGSLASPNNVGTMTADFCSNDTALSINTSLCSTGQAKNFYKWTSPQASQQTYSVVVTYQLPSTFNGFASDDTVQLTARTDSTSNAAVTYEMFKSDGSTVVKCGTSETTVVTSANTWQTVGINGNEATGCSFTSSAAGNFVIFKINLKAQSNANAYVSTLGFTTTGR